MTTSTVHQPYATASLYVGDLAADVNETVLFEIFNSIGPVASIRVCRESGTRKSLGYAYVNYQAVVDAERAFDTLNFALIKGVPCRIMWSQRDPSLRKSGTGNVFIKNLDKSIDNKALYDTFSLFGDILSCKVAVDEFGKSKGYGFIHYVSEESGKNAIEKINGMLIGSKMVYVGPFKKQGERQTSKSAVYTNLYVKHFPSDWTEEMMRETFSRFGKVTSVAITTDSKGRRFGFVNYDDSAAAKAAVDALHGNKNTQQEGASNSTKPTEGHAEKSTSPSTAASSSAGSSSSSTTTTDNDDSSSSRTEDAANANTANSAQASKNVAAAGHISPTSDSGASKPSQASSDDNPEFLYVQRAMDKGERISLLREQFSASSSAKQRRQGLNLYIKNLDDEATDESLRDVFSAYGTVTSAKIMRDENGRSKGFGFVCFAFPSDATKAVTAMHFKLFLGKPLYVGLAEKRETRSARLQQRFRMAATRPGPAAAASAHSMYMGSPAAAAGHPGGGAQMMASAAYGSQAHMYGYGGPAGTAQGPHVMQQRPMAHAGMLPAGAAAWRQQQMRPYVSQAPLSSGGGGGAPSGSTPSYPYQSLGAGVGAGGQMNQAGMPGGGSAGGYPMRNSIGQRPRGGAQGVAGPMGQNPQANFKFTSQVRNRDFPSVAHHGGPGVPTGMAGPHGMGPDSLVSSAEPISAQTLAAAHPQMQKQILGEKLFPLVSKHQPALAGKITGMMLEMDNGDLLQLLESEAQLQTKVDEAMNVLNRHQSAAASAAAAAGLLPAVINPSA